MSTELIPGTSLPIQGSFGSPQHEGRDFVNMAQGREPRSLFERIGDADGVTPGEKAFIMGALRAFDNRPRQLKTISAQASGQTDATTGNMVVPFFQVPAGCEAHVANVTVDVPGSATITPAQPFSNNAAWAFIASGPETTGAPASTADSLRFGMLTFAPASSGGPILPGQWTFNDSNAPVGQSGDTIYFVLHGGSQTALQAIGVQVTYRVNLFGYENGQL